MGYLNDRMARVVGGGMDPKGFQRITDLSSAVSLTVPAGSTYAMIYCETQDVRWRDDGTAPTTTVGMPLAVDTLFEYTGDLSAIQFIEEQGTASLVVSYYGDPE